MILLEFGNSADTYIGAYFEKAKDINILKDLI